jgi:23S rRNA pseudouridine2605 synthase
VRGRVTPQVVQQLKHGVDLEDGMIRADRARVIQQQGDDRHSMVELTLHSGRNRIVRRMLDAVGHPVVELVRRSFGPLNLGTLRSGAMRELTKVELGQLLTISRAADAARDAGTASNEGDS